MKRIKGLTQPTPGLQRYLDEHPWTGIARETREWKQFRDYESSAAYNELMAELEQLQQGLCAFCEIELTELNHQIEHFHPKSKNASSASAADWMFIPDNLLAACKGGSVSYLEPPHSLPPIHTNQSCGQAKGDEILDDIILKPSTLSLQPSFFTVSSDGLLNVNRDHCDAASCNKAEKTIEKLNLNCTRLKNARRTVREALEEEQQIRGINTMDDETAIAELTTMATSHLQPDPATDRLLPFFTTRRSFFGGLAEKIIAQA